MDEKIILIFYGPTKGILSRAATLRAELRERIPFVDLASFMQNKFVLILPNIRSGHNVGAMFRTADGAGVDKLYLTGYTPVPPHKAIDKVSLGAEKTVPHEYHKQTGRLVRKLKAAGYTIVALEQSPKSVTIYEWQPVFPLALIVGNEKTGVTKNILALCDAVIHLPMRGTKNSLNVSIAAGVAMYHLSEKVK